MRKLTILLLFTLITVSAQAQLYGNKWRFGVSTGITNYMGDIRPLKINDFGNFTRLYERYDNYSQQLSYQVSLEYALGNSVGLMLSAGTYQFGAGDRLVQNDGTLFEDGLNFDRALNFQTDLYDAGLSFVIKPDNDWLLGGKSIVAPYITLGLGVQTFAVNGDLLDANENRYDYTNPNTIPDGTFETQLNDLGTENPDGYRNTTLYANLGLGVRFRITKSLELFAQSDFKRAATDYLDDVAGQYRTSYDNEFQAYAAQPGTNLVTPENTYRGFENRKVDWYIYHGMGIKFSFGANKKAFRAPVITQRYTYQPSAQSLEQMRQEAARDTNTGQTNYITVIQLPQKRTTATSDSLVSGLDSLTIESIRLQLDSIRSDSTAMNTELAQYQNELSEFSNIRRITIADSTVSQSVREARVANLDTEETRIQNEINTLASSQNRNTVSVDSLNLLLLTERSVVPTDSIDYNELLIYPGEVTRIEYGNTRSTKLLLDSATTASNATMMTKDEFDEQINKFRNEMLQAQATRDSAMMMAFAAKYQDVSPEESEAAAVEQTPQEITIAQEILDDKTAQKVQKNNEKARKAEKKAAKREERLNKKNNELLKDALLVGGAVAATAAITSDGKDDQVPTDTVFVQPDSILMARIVSDSLLIDSLRSIPQIRDTVLLEKTIPLLLQSSKIDVFFGINERVLTESEAKKLESISDYLVKNPDVIIELIGFADNTGSVAYNLQISRDRVDAVEAALINNHAISPDRIEKETGGLILRGQDKQSMDQDRKVEIRLFQKK